MPGKDGATIVTAVNGPAVAVVQEPTPVLRAPLDGSKWVVANGLSNPDHRPSFAPVDGRVRIAPRFAIDWVRLGSDGRVADEKTVLPRTPAATRWALSDT